MDEVTESGSGELANERDAVLLRRWADGEQQAGATVVRRHFATVYRFLRRRLGAAAEDVTQQTFEAAARRVERLAQVRSVRAFLLGVARNQALMHLRAEDVHDRRRVHVSGTQPGPTLSIPGRVEARREQRRLLEAMQKLPVEYQVTLELYYWEGLTNAEIAAVLEVSTSTITSRLSRARDLLRRHMLASGASNDNDLPPAELDAWARSVRALLDDATQGQ